MGSGREANTKNNSLSLEDNLTINLEMKTKKLLNDGKHHPIRNLSFKSMRSYLRDLVYVMIAFFIIVNNWNILTDGTDERKYFYKKYNEL